jgi:hypothetical protein
VAFAVNQATLQFIILNLPLAANNLAMSRQAADEISAAACPTDAEG